MKKNFLVLFLLAIIFLMLLHNAFAHYSVRELFLQHQKDYSKPSLPYYIVPNTYVSPVIFPKWIYFGDVFSNFKHSLKPKTFVTTSRQTSFTSIKEFTVSGSEFSFSPRTLRVAKGDMVRINFVNSGMTAHTFTVSGLGVDTGLIQPGSSKSIEFTTPNQNSTFTSFCSVPGHKEAGMSGTIIVN